MTLKLDDACEGCGKSFFDYEGLTLTCQSCGAKFCTECVGDPPKKRCPQCHDDPGGK